MDDRTFCDVPMNPLVRRAPAGLIALACALLAGCGEDPPPPAAPTAAARPAAAAAQPPAPAVAPAKKPDPRRITAMLAIAREDFVAGRFVSPPDANALQGYLDVRALDPDNDTVRVALVDLYPIAAEQAEKALAAGDPAEAARIVALLKLAAPESLGLDGLDQRIGAAQAASAEAAPEAAADGPESTPDATPAAQPATAPVAADGASPPPPGTPPAEATPQQH
jgi:hypothetical protein